MKFVIDLDNKIVGGCCKAKDVKKHFEELDEVFRDGGC